MTEIANTPKPPYYAVIFTSVRTDIEDGYAETANRMLNLAAEQPGFLGFESAREAVGITVSYWSDLQAIKGWKQNVEHIAAQEKGKSVWYSAFTTRICKVEREYSM
ncbi:antibiotic biosynthesis monooxygenase family protein [Glaciecola sp. 1036]|uniref:antibiotic biosynthesis monooxygenase family protein n=1 Tax=Alteromonadaceae TaxID=72275 RepID=UPI003CFD226D